MDKVNLNKIICCPRCKGDLKIKNEYECDNCGQIILIKSKIINVVYTPSQKTKIAKKVYEFLHSKVSGGPRDGSYDILASFARGNKSLDVACGEGIIETLSPNTIGVDFSLNALLKAQKKGVKHLLQANAEYLPFKDNSFDIAICNGSLEHFANPQKALNEMVRVSKIQIITIHKEFDFPFSRFTRKLYDQITNIENQPIEIPLTSREVEKLYLKAKTHVVYKGVWTFPINFGRTNRFIPTLNFPSCHFIISYKL